MKRFSFSFFFALFLNVYSSFAFLCKPQSKLFLSHHVPALQKSFSYPSSLSLQTSLKRNGYSVKLNNLNDDKDDYKSNHEDSIFENGFIVDKMNPEVTDVELDERNIVKIVRGECTDEEVNMLAWKCLGYVYNAEGTEDNSNAVSKWYENIEKTDTDNDESTNTNKNKDTAIPALKWTPPPFPENPMWQNENVFPKWREKYPSPPDCS